MLPSRSSRNENPLIFSSNPFEQEFPFMSQLPDYVASVKPNPKENRAPWLTTTAATYAGVMLWFAFWQGVPMGGKGIAGGTLSQGLGTAVLALIVAAFLCHFCCYLVPGLLGMKTGLGLAVIGTSTYGVKGGYFMPGFLMGALQFGWLSVNAYFSGLLLSSIIFGSEPGSAAHLGLGVVWILVATFVGMKGVKYVGAVASFTPILPLIVLGLLLVNTIGGVGEFSVEKMMDAAKTTMPDAKPAMLFGSGFLGVLSLMCAYVFGFFATAGAAGVDFGSNNKDAKSVQMAGYIGIVLATVLTGVIALLAVAGAQKTFLDKPELLTQYNAVQLFDVVFGTGTAKICMLLLTLAAFPSACFPTVVASGAFKTTFPKVNPLISCGIGVLVAIILVVTQAAGSAEDVFTVVGASFGPICGAMAADYVLSGFKWAGPRDGFNMAGWISWFFGFLVGGVTLVVTVFLKQEMPFVIPCPPVAAFVVGFVLYIILAKAGLESKKLDMPQRIDL